MTLPKKALLFLGIAFSGLIGTLYMTSSAILLYNLRQAEEQYTRQAVKGVLGAFTQAQEDFNYRFTDWAVWDETYKFIKGANKDYVEANLTPKVLATLKVNLALFIQPSGQIVFGTGFDLIREKQIPIPEALRTHLSSQDLLLQHPSTESSLAGIMLLPEGLMLISSRPILTGESKGPVGGTLVFGRFIDAEVIAKLSRSSRLPITMHAVNEKKPASRLPSSA